MSNRKIKRDPSFYYYNLSILIFIILAFGANALVNTKDLPPISTVVIIHAISMFIWYFLIVMQSKLIERKNHALHMKLGLLSVGLAIVILLSGIAMTLDTYVRLGRADIVAVNLFITINFFILYTLAFVKRKNPAAHKRLMLYASISMILPARSHWG